MEVNKKSKDLCALLQASANMIPPNIADIPQGDMPGDKINIGEEHIAKATIIFPVLLNELTSVLTKSNANRAVITVCGGSGVGKSEIASLLAHYLRNIGVGAYTLSGDNYPHRIPRDNDSERARIFRTSGVRGLITNAQYSNQCVDALQKLQRTEQDACPTLCAEYPFLEAYQCEGRKALKGYLGTDMEQNFNELTNIVSQFKNGANTIWLKRMGRADTDLWYDNVDFTNVKVLIIEWTHGNSDGYQGVDIPVLLNSTPKETAEHRKLRNRDGKTDSPFTTMVLELEQQALNSQAHKAKIIVAKNGDLISYHTYLRLMSQE